MKKRIFAVPAIVLGLAVAGSVYAFTNNPTPVKKAVVVKSASTIETPTEPEPVQAAPVEQPQAEVTPTPSPTYGQSPDNADLYIVFDKTAVMNAAGVPPEQQADADRLISVLTDWTYKSNVEPLTNLCIVRPPSLMSSAGADWADNPVTQLKWCNDFLLNRHGTWRNAIAWYQVHGTNFGTGQ